MKQNKLLKESAAFILLESIIQKALIAHIEREHEWEIQKVYFEDEWTAGSLDDEVAETFGLQVASVSAEFLDEGIENEAEEEDSEWRNLISFDVTFIAQGALAEVLSNNGCDVELVASVNNEAIGESVSLSDEKAVLDSVSLLSVLASPSTDENDLHSDLDNWLQGIAE